MSDDDSFRLFDRPTAGELLLAVVALAMIFWPYTIWPFIK